MIKRVLKALSFILISILCSVLSCQKEPKTVAVTGITLSQTSVELIEGESTRITATISPSNATNKTVIWSSDNSYVTVSDGTITGAKPCSATVTAKSDDGGKTATCSVIVKSKVIQVTGVTLDKSELTLTEGDTQSLTAAVSPDNATDKSVTWSSNNTSIATVSSSGVVMAKSPGTATITVRTNDGGKTATCAVTVKAKVISVTGVSLDKTSLTMTEDDTQTLTATVSPSNATDKSVTWSTNNASVAEVSSTGVVFAKSAGTATITVKTTDGAKTATCAVTVKAKVISVTGVSLDKTSLTMTEGDTQTLTATVTPSNATDKSISWSSADESIATVDGSGKIIAKSTGNTVIYATANGGSGVFASCAVRVKPEGAVDLGLSVYWASFNVGASKPEEFGDYYAWGETETKEDYSWSTYKWCNGSYNTLTKYNSQSEFGTVDNKTTLDSEDDVATTKLGGKWRMPTEEEWTELKIYCTIIWTTQNGVNGILITGLTGNTIFLPAAGAKNGTNLGGADSDGIYWSSSCHKSSPLSACGEYLENSYPSDVLFDRVLGASVRPVCPKK